MISTHTSGTNAPLYRGKRNERYVGAKGLDGLYCPITKRIIGSPLTEEELVSIEHLKKPFGCGYKHVLPSSNGRSFRACFSYGAKTKDLGHRKNPAEAALLYHLSPDHRKPALLVSSQKDFIQKHGANSLFYLDINEEDITELEYLKSVRNKHGYRNIEQTFATGRYTANITVDHRTIYLGSYLTVLEAAMSVHIFFQTGKIVRNLTPKHSMTSFVLTEVELEKIKAIVSTKAASGYSGVLLYKNKYTASWSAYKEKLGLGRYLTKEEAAWACYLWLEYGLRYKEIMLLARTGRLYPDATQRVAEYTLEDLLPDNRVDTSEFIVGGV